jgi:hypothetical protein
MFRISPPFGRPLSYAFPRRCPPSTNTGSERKVTVSDCALAVGRNRYVDRTTPTNLAIKPIVLVYRQQTTSVDA